jgi:hypothetical protein
MGAAKEEGMGYSLWFGEFGVDTEPEGRWANPTAQKPEGVEWPEDAPLNSSGDTSNHCMPSYSAWGAFCNRTGLEEVFRELIAEHPGVAPLTAEHLEVFRAAQHKLAMGGWDGERAEAVVRESKEAAECAGRDWWLSSGADVPEVAWDALRLRWLVFWAEWCLEHCKYPTFANS